MTQPLEWPVRIRVRIRNLRHPNKEGIAELNGHIADPYPVVAPNLAQHLDLQPEGRATVLLPGGIETSREMGQVEISFDGTEWSKIDIIRGEQRDFPRPRHGPFTLKATCPECGPRPVLRLLPDIIPTWEAMDAAEKGELALARRPYHKMPKFVCSVCKSAIPALGTQE